jgi:hypothetical protein
MFASKFVKKMNDGIRLAKSASRSAVHLAREFPMEPA